MANHNVSLNGLRVFEAAARHLNFTSAALELNVSQAAVSQQIRNLEDQLGSKLFERGARALSLTIAGRDLSVATSSALHTINNSLNSITGENDSSVLTISTLPSFASRWLVPRLDEFQNAHPDIDLHVHTSGSKVDLLGNKIDAAIRLAAADETGLVTELLFPDALCLISTPDVANEIGSDINGLYRFGLATDSTQVFGNEPVDFTGSATNISLRKLGLDFSKLNMRRFTSSENVIQSALDGKATAMTRLSLCADDLDAGRLSILFNHCEPLRQGTSLVYPKFRKNDIKLRLLRSWLRTEAGTFSQKLSKYLPN